MKARAPTKKVSIRNLNHDQPRFKSAEEAMSWQVDFSQKAKTSEHAVILLDDIENISKRESFLDGDRRCFFPKATTEPIDYNKIISSIRKLKLPIVPCRSKSGGLHLFIFFDKPIAAKLVREKLKEISFFGDANFKGWKNSEFKDYIYIIVEEYSRAKLLKFSLSEFVNYPKVKQAILNRKNVLYNDEDCIAGMDRDFYADKIQDLSFLMRGGNETLNNKTGKLPVSRTLKIGCTSEFFSIYTTMVNLDTDNEKFTLLQKTLFKEDPKKFRKQALEFSQDLATHFYRKRKDINGKKAMSIGRKENMILFLKIADWFYTSGVLSPEERTKELFKIMKAFAELEIDDLNQIFWSFFKFLRFFQALWSTYFFRI